MNDLLAGLNGGNVPALDLIFMITLVALLPSIAVMMTSFTRTIIILSFTRNAMGIQQTPPNTVLVGISLFLTLYIMSPVIGRVNAEAYEPYTRGEMCIRDRTRDSAAGNGQPEEELPLAHAADSQQAVQPKDYGTAGQAGTQSPVRTNMEELPEAFAKTLADRLPAVSYTHLFCPFCSMSVLR